MTKDNDIDFTTKPTFAAEDLSPAQNHAIDYAMDVCLMMAHVVQQATEYAQRDEYDQYQNLLDAAVKEAGADDMIGGKIAEVYLQKFEFSSLQIFASLAQAQPDEVAEYIRNNVTTKSAHTGKIGDLIKGFHDHKSKSK